MKRELEMAIQHGTITQYESKHITIWMNNNIEILVHRPGGK
jgi:hypothetical protein